PRTWTLSWTEPVQNPSTPRACTTLRPIPHSALRVPHSSLPRGPTVDPPRGPLLGARGSGPFRTQVYPEGLKSGHSNGSNHRKLSKNIASNQMGTHLTQ